MEISFYIPHGMKVHKVAYLPYEQSYPACDLETKQDIKVYSGEFIDAFEMDGVLYVSDKVYKYLLSLPNQ